MSKDMGALSGSREPDPSCTGSGPSGFDPERKLHRYALNESGWIELSEGWKFLFGGTRELAGLFHRWGILDAGGFTTLGSRLRDNYGRGKVSLPDTVPASAIEAATAGETVKHGSTRRAMARSATPRRPGAVP